VGKPMPTPAMTRHPNAAWVVFMEEKNMGVQKDWVVRTYLQLYTHYRTAPKSICHELEPKKKSCACTYDHLPTAPLARAPWAARHTWTPWSSWAGHSQCPGPTPAPTSPLPGLNGELMNQGWCAWAQDPAGTAWRPWPLGPMQETDCRVLPLAPWGSARVPCPTRGKQHRHQWHQRRGRGPSAGLFLVHDAAARGCLNRRPASPVVQRRHRRDGYRRGGSAGAGKQGGLLCWFIHVDKPLF
jgi:hypothetical protein